MPGSATDKIPAVHAAGPPEEAVVLSDSSAVQRVLLERRAINEAVEAHGVGGFCRHVVSKPMSTSMAHEHADALAREYRGVPFAVTLARCI